MINRKDILGLINFLDEPLEFYKDPVYTNEEKEDIKKFEHLALELYKDAKNDGYIILPTSKLNKSEEERSLKITKIIIDISNKLVKTNEFNAEEALFILLSFYCGICELIKNLLLDIAVNIYKDKGRKKFGRFMMMGDFMKIMREYKNRKYIFLFSDIDVDLRNSFAHGTINFTNGEIEYYDSKNRRKSLDLIRFISKYKKLPPLYATLFLYRTKVFVEEIRDYAKKQGFV